MTSSYIKILTFILLIFTNKSFATPLYAIMDQTIVTAVTKQEEVNALCWTDVAALRIVGAVMLWDPTGGVAEKSVGYLLQQK